MKLKKWVCALSLVLGVQESWAANLVTNPDFDSDLSGWSEYGNGFGFWDGSMGSPSAGSLAVHGSYVTGCIQISAQNIDFAARANVFNDAFVMAYLGGFFTTDCSGSATGTAPLRLFFSQSTGGAWETKSLTNQPLPVGTQSVYVVLSSTFEVHFDHIQFGPTGTAPVSLQSFDVQ